MRIAIDVRSLMEGRQSGVEEYTTQIIRGLLRIGRGHAYCVFYNSWRPVALPDFGGAVTVSAHRWPNRLLNAVNFTLNWPAWDGWVEADCFFLPNFRLLPLSPGVPLVTTVHDLSFDHFPEFFSRRRRLWHRSVRPRVLLRNSDHIIAVSQATREDIISTYGMAPESVSVVYSGVHLPWEAETSDSGALKRVGGAYRLPRRYVLYLGTIEPRKNVAGIVEAFDAIADSVPQDLVIAGEQGWLIGEARRAWQRARHRARVHFPGFIAGRDKAAVMAAADLFVYPSLYEGFGFPPLEALLASTPVVTSYNASLPEIVGAMSAGERAVTLVDPWDVSELALVMRELLTDVPPVTGAVRECVRRTYNWDRAAHETLDIIERVV
ncbi:MAG: glycosyltransferase family 4 protein [Candidatus Andersenbacteria bacterium]|nr:glycosyltransferase family 4 protein [Candidatus Andersenbacteria bacterium]